MATITDPTSSMTVTLSDNVGQKIFGTTADKLILEGDPNHRKKLPTIIKETEGITKKMKLRITNTSTERNIRFIITDIEDNSSQSSSITTPPSENTSSSNVPHKTPTSSSAQNQPKVKRALNFENTGDTHYTLNKYTKKKQLIVNITSQVWTNLMQARNEHVGHNKDNGFVYQFYIANPLFISTSYYLCSTNPFTTIPTNLKTISYFAYVM